MTKDAIIVPTDPAEPQIAKVRELLPKPKIIVGNSVDIFKQDAFKQGAAEASVLFNWSGSLALMKQVFAACPNLLWVHSRSVGLERTLFPELVESAVPLTNGIGVFSPALGEFVLARLLYFAKGVRR